MPGPTVHFRYTVEWAVAARMPRQLAERVADSCAKVDALWPGSTLWTRHFDPTATLFWLPVYFARAVRDASPRYLGYAIHCRQDAIGHGLLGLSHLRYRFGLLDRDPDDWALMPARTRARMERATGRIVRAYLKRTAGRASADPDDD
jgi:hypothetical protein